MQRTLLSMPMIAMMFMTLALCQNKGSIIMSEKNIESAVVGGGSSGVLRLYLNALKELWMLFQVMLEDTKKIQLIKM